MDDADGADEQREVYRRRFREARQAGMSIVEAQLFADSDQDIGTLRKLVKAGCPPDVMARIVV